MTAWDRLHSVSHMWTVLGPVRGPVRWILTGHYATMNAEYHYWNHTVGHSVHCHEPLTITYFTAADGDFPTKGCTARHNVNAQQTWKLFTFAISSPFDTASPVAMAADPKCCQHCIVIFQGIWQSMKIILVSIRYSYTVPLFRCDGMYHHSTGTCSRFVYACSTHFHEQTSHQYSHIIRPRQHNIMFVRLGSLDGRHNTWSVPPHI